MDKEAKLKKLISEAKIENAFEVLLQSKEGDKIRNDIYHIKARLKRLEDQKFKETISQVDYNIEHNKIIEVALKLVTIAYTIKDKDLKGDIYKIPDIFTSWGFDEKKEFIQILLESQTFGNSETRNAFVSELPQEIKSRINRDGPPLIEVKNIIETTLAFKEGWQIFYKLFESFEGDSNAFSKIKSFINGHRDD